MKTKTVRASKEVKKEAKKMMNCHCNASIVILNRNIDDHGHGDYTCWYPCCGLQVDITR